MNKSDYILNIEYSKINIFDIKELILNIEYSKINIFDVKELIRYNNHLFSISSNILLIQ